MSFVTARLRGTMTAPIREKPVAAGQVWSRGALLVMDANGAWAECGADPAAIAAVAETDYGPNTTGFVHTGRNEFPPGFCQATLVSRDQTFHALYMGALPAAAGASYGVTRDADGLWKVDFAKTAGTARVKLISIDWTQAPLNRNRVEVAVLAANVQVVG